MLRPLITEAVAMIAVTPMMMPRSVRNERSGFATSEDRAMRRPSMRFTAPSARPAEHAGGLLRREVGADAAVVDGHDAAGAQGDVPLVRHDHHRVPLAVQPVEEVHDLGAGGGVE